MATTEGANELLCALRMEKIFIIFAHHNDPNQDHWLVVPGHKPVSRGQVVTWKAFGHLHKVVLDLPDVFEPSMVTIHDCGEGKARVKDDAQPGDYHYKVICNDGKEDKEAVGGSHPSVIIDGGR